MLDRHEESHLAQAVRTLPANARLGAAGIFIEQADVEEQLAIHSFLARLVSTYAMFFGPTGDIPVQLSFGFFGWPLPPIVIH